MIRGQHRPVKCCTYTSQCVAHSGRFMTAQVVQNLKSVFADANRLDADQLADIYHPDIVFSDPIHTLEGLGTVSGYFAKMYQNVSSCQFDYIDEMITDNKASLRWEMHLKHPRLDGGSEIVVAGASFLRFDQKITHHDDYYDLGAMLYEHIAVLGTGVRYVKGRLR